MAPSWSRRTLLFAENPLPSAPMWNRPTNRSPIFLTHTPPPASPMWARPSTTTPIFEDAVISPESMWARPTTGGVPSCPCCVSAAYTSPTTFVMPRSPPPTPPRSPVSFTGTASDSPVSAEAAVPKPPPQPRLRKIASTASLRKMPSAIGLQLKRSFAQLRTRVSVD